MFQVCAFDRVVDNSLQLMRLGERLLGPRLLQCLLSPLYTQFVAGGERHELAAVMSSLRENNVRFMLTSMLEADVGEGEASEKVLTANLEESVRQLVMVKELSVEGQQPAIQGKCTAHLDTDILVHASRVFAAAADPTRLVEQLASGLVTSGQVTVPGLTRQQQAAWDAALLRLKTLGDACVQHGVLLYVDAEFTYTNPAISWLTLALMVALNQHRPIIRGTYQCYLKATPVTLAREHALCRRLGACFGAKLVRGAYMARERQLAAEEGRESPVCESYQDTSDNYTRAVEFALRCVAEDCGRTQVMVATHNQQSVQHALQLSSQLRLQPGHVCFGQVYGMADYLTVPLARAGQQVYKAVPFGEFSTVMPYLSRRTAESRLLQQGVRVERDLLLSELKRRLVRQPRA